jgi:hypothetical protein
MAEPTPNWRAGIGGGGDDAAADVVLQQRKGIGRDARQRPVGVARQQHLVDLAPAAADDHRQALQLRIAQQFDGREERVHVEVGDAAHGGHGRHCGRAVGVIVAGGAALSRCPAAGCRLSTWRMSVRPQKAIDRSSSLRMISSALLHAFLAHRAQAVQHGAADVGALGAERHGLQHVLAGADAAVHVHLDAVAHRVDDLGQRGDGGGRAIELAAAVVGDDQRVGAGVGGQRASSTSCTPLRISLPPQRFLIHSTSAHDRRGSNCLAVHSDSEPMFSTPLTWPTMLPNWRRLRAQHAQAPARLGRHVEDVGERQLGRRRQAVLDVLVALAEDLQVQREHQRRAAGGLGAVDQAFDEAAVAHHVQLEPERVPLSVPRPRPRSSRCSWSTA